MFSKSEKKEVTIVSATPLDQKAMKEIKAEVFKQTCFSPISVLDLCIA